MALKAVCVVLLSLAGFANAQDCPKIDPQEQLVKERQCRAKGGEWGRKPRPVRCALFGARPGRAGKVEPAREFLRGRGEIRILNAALITEARGKQCRLAQQRVRGRRGVELVEEIGQAAEPLSKL